MVPTEELKRKLELVVQTGLLLAKHSDLQVIVQAATDAGLELCGAQFGAFFYNVTNAQGESYLLYTLSGVEREKFAHFPMPRNTAVLGPPSVAKASFAPTTSPKTRDTAAMHLTTESRKGISQCAANLAVPVMAQSREVLGGLFYGHEEVGIFPQETEDLVASVAAQAAISIENARLREQQIQKVATAEKDRQEQRELARRLSESAAIIASSNDAIISKDLTGVIRSWNPAATRIFGYMAEEIIGQSILRLIPEDLHHEEPVILAKIGAGEKIEHYETVRVTKTGKRIEVSLSISPVRDDSGNIVGASKVLRDVSAKRLAEASLM